MEIVERSTLQHQLTLTGLERYQNYSVRVVAATRVGQGLKSRSIYCRTNEDGKKENWYKIELRGGKKAIAVEFVSFEPLDI